MSTINLNGTEYELVPVIKKPEAEWIKQEVHAKTLDWGPVSTEKMNWKQANEWCKVQGGRLPTTIELQQALADKIEGFLAVNFWSAITYPYTGFQCYAMVVNFHDGFVNYSLKASSNYVRVCRG